MGRPKSREKVHIFDNRQSPNWYCWFIELDTGKRVHRVTKFRKDEYTRDQVQEIIDGELGTKHVEKNSIDWLGEHTCCTLEMEGISEQTISLYKLAFRHLKAIYGGSYSIYKLDRSAIRTFQTHLHEKGTGNTGINTYLRALRAAFERLVLDDKLDKNPFYRFKSLPVNKQKQKHLTLEEAKRFINVVNNSKNEDAKHLTRILIYTGIRRGEVVSIERDDVDMEKGYFEAINIKSRDRHKVQRNIPEQLFGDFLYFLNKSNSDYPFKVCHPDTLTDWVKGYLREARLSEDLHCHSLRHTFITLGLENGNITIREMQKYIDHSSVSVTELYAHDKAEKTPEIELE